MSALVCEVWRSSEQLRAWAGAWDDLWQRSASCMPLSRAESVAQWCEHFAPRAALHVLAVRQGRELVAALPLVERRVAPGVTIAELPNNPWSICGDLLVDPTLHEAALDGLLTQLRRLPCGLLRLTPVELEAARWSAFRAAVDRAGLGHAEQDHYGVGRLSLPGDWNAFMAQASGNHRRYLRKAQRRADAAGKVTLHVVDNPPREQVAPLLERGFAVEDRSWKGREGTSVIRTPGMLAYFIQQAEQLARWGQLRLVFLELNGEPIAFEYGYLAKGAYFTPKVGYDESFASLSPSQVLRPQLFERCCNGGDVQQIDFWGPESDATQRWSNGRYTMGRIALSTARPMSRLMFLAYRASQHARQAILRWKAERTDSPSTNRVSAAEDADVIASSNG